MSDSRANSEPILWMMIGTPSETSIEGSKEGTEFIGGLIGSDEEAVESPEKAEKHSKASIKFSQLQENFKQFFGIVGDLFIQAEQQVQSQRNQPISETVQQPSIQLDQIEFFVGINSEGEVGFWGLAKGKVSGMTEIKLTFKRKE